MDMRILSKLTDILNSIESEDSELIEFIKVINTLSQQYGNLQSLAEVLKTNLDALTLREENFELQFLQHDLLPSGSGIKMLGGGWCIQYGVTPFVPMIPTYTPVGNNYSITFPIAFTQLIYLTTQIGAISSHGGFLGFDNVEFYNPLVGTYITALFEDCHPGRWVAFGKIT